MVMTTSAAGDAEMVHREALTFRLGAEEYAIDILHVQEIRSYERPTRIANAPAHLLGVTNLRGDIVPIVDLRIRFGLDAGYNSATVVVVLNIGRRTVGAVVDSVSDVQALARGDVKAVPDIGNGIESRQIVGLACVRHGERERMLILLNIEPLLGNVDVGLPEELAA